MTKLFDAKLEILVDPIALAQRVATWMLEIAIAKKGNFTVSLSGGSTPRRLYELLARPPYCDAFPWNRTHWFWGDERFVPHSDKQSNYRMVNEAMLSHASIPAANIHPIPTEEISVDAAASIYEHELKAFYGAERLESGRPFFDVVLLGLGFDGHTASLFPNTDVLKIRDRWVAEVTDPKSVARITLTYPLLESSRYAAFLITGNEKKDIFNRFLHGEENLPAARLHPIGKLIYFVDAAAASDMSL
jgi:6-phosphogluconolactonase